MPGQAIGSDRDRRDAIVAQSTAGRVTTARRRATAVRRRACVLAALAATAAFGLALGGRAVAQVDPTTPSSLADTCAPTEGPPTPTPSPTEPSPTPTPTTPTQTPSPTPEPTPTPTPTPSPTPEPSPTEPCPTSNPSPTDTSPTAAPRPAPATSTTPPAPTEAPLSTPTIPAPGEPSAPPAQPPPGPIPTRPAHDRALAQQAEEVSTSIAGTYSTAALDDVYDKLVKAGMSRDVATRRVYRPFIVRGPAAWTETWHAPRYAGGFHLHEGQDVLCREGAPVLAVTAGRVEFDVGVLGGRVARLFLPDGGYWYYAHLSDWNSTLESGSQVELGDVIGYCGNTGDAVGGPTHVHFGHYLPSRQAVDPMSDLIAWLEAAERRAGVTERGAEAARSTTTVVPTYPHELGAEPPVTVTVSNPVVTAGLSTSTARTSAAPSATDVLALAVVVAARLLLIPGRRVARRLRSLGGRGTG
jgi:murein DD-endopeptidase MepM/ murein hydrolase activator NlpD